MPAVLDRPDDEGNNKKDTFITFKEPKHRYTIDELLDMRQGRIPTTMTVEEIDKILRARF